MADCPDTPSNPPSLGAYTGFDKCNLNGLLERTEDAAMYITGGYHPIEIGDELHHGRYRIIHRLGHGGYATVWLALNQHCSLPNAPRLRYVAVKIAAARSKRDEAAVLRRFSPPHQPQPTGWFHWLRSLNASATDTQHEQCPSIISLLDEFEINGPNGSHRCTVTEVLGPSVAAVKLCTQYGDEGMSPMMGRRLAVQAAKALAFLHSHGIAHAVDIDSWTVQELYAALGGEPITVPFSSALGFHSVTVEVPAHPPQYLVCAPPVPKLWALCNGSVQNIRVIDFGESFSLPFSGQKLPGTPLQFAAPELLLNQPSHITEAIDIWALGNTIYELQGWSELFYYLGNPKEYISDIVGTFGGKEAMPESFWNACCEMGVVEYLDESDPELLDWDGRFRGPFKKDVEEVLRSVLGVSMVIDPVHRATAQVIVEMMPEAWETSMEVNDEEEIIQPLNDDEEETILNSDDEEETIQPLNNGDEEEIIQPLINYNEETIQPPNNDGPGGSGVCGAEGERE